ncbi:hypothetical protein XA68_10463 [Ophiocordyceps unilateralis]|uniref:Thymidylate kinase n=1 Tax=Ophiocordyceps unilateralis TaxID=268505 RepID=A0A2A9NYX0_OPHUN|nr:hypothetical protein XA68_10463 [Ophiocordyceps unilateralis]
MAAVARQPFAPLDGSRLQTLTSVKNRQNALPSGVKSKRKAYLLDSDDSENVDPSLSAKRSKAVDGPSGDVVVKKPLFVVTRAASTPHYDARPLSSPIKPASTTCRPLQRKSPAVRTGTGIIKSSPLSAPAGRSPTRGKRTGLLTSRRRYTRVDPPAFSLGSPAPFSLDAALKGTIPSYVARPPTKGTGRGILPSPVEPETKASWFFDIHEDTPEQEMTNLLQHSTCVLDISSDEENERKDMDEGRDKENVPPADDVSQTSVAARPAPDVMVVDKERVALGEMKVADFFPDGCDETSVVIVPGDDDDEDSALDQAKLALTSHVAEAETDAVQMVEQMMGSSVDELSSKAAVLQPMEGTGESFELWESGSSKDESEPVVV